MARQRRVHIPNSFVHVSRRCRDGDYLLEAPAVKELFLTVLAEVALAMGYQVAYYCIQDNHIHLLLFTPATIEGHTLRWTPQPGDAGSRVVTVTAEDAGGASSTAALELVVARANAAPAFTEDGPLELSSEGGTRIELALPAVDPDADVLAWAIDVMSTGFSIDAATGLLTFDPEGLESGSYDVTVVVSDGRATDFRVVSVEVERASGAPVVALMVVGFVLLAGAGAAVVFRRS